MTSIEQLINTLESNNPDCEVSGDFRAITSLRFAPRDKGDLGEICIFSEAKRGVVPGDKTEKCHWQYFIPHTAISSEFYSTVDRSLSVWNFAGKILRLGVEIYALDESGNLFGIHHKDGVRVISQRAMIGK